MANVTCMALVNYKYEFLLLLLLPIATIFGNGLVVIAVLREKTLKTSTNFLLVSLAVADLMVAILVMPFGTYTLVNNLQWELPVWLCYLHLVGDVSASTSSIVHMVAVSADRFFAVFYHIHYKTNKHKQFIILSILLCWVFSFGVAMPAWTGFRSTNCSCFIESADFMLYGSLFAFFIPCIVMFMTYSFVFYRLKTRFHTLKMRELAQAAAQVSPSPSGQFLESMLSRAHGGIDQVRRNTLNWAMPFVGQGTDAEEFIDETDSVSSGDLEELTTILFQMESTTTNSDCLNHLDESDDCSVHNRRRQNARTVSLEALLRTIGRLSRNFSKKRRQSMHAASEHIRKLKFRAADCFTRLKSKQGKAIKKETKATQLVTTVLVVFLICWLPFFALNIIKAVYLKMGLTESWPFYGEILLIVFTWLGYSNSCLNPIIYSVLNKRFRSGFQRLLACNPNEVDAMEKRREKSTRLRELQLRSVQIVYGGSPKSPNHLLNKPEFHGSALSVQDVYL